VHHDPFLVFVMLLLGGLAVFMIWLATAYNKLVRLRNRADALWADIDVQLKRRHDLVPNLVEVVSGYATHESGTLNEVATARNQAVAATSPTDQAQAENVLTGALGKLFANVERYPALKAEGDFQRLESQLAEIEQTIAMSRQAYNLTVQSFNNAVDTFPTNIAAWFSDFQDRAYLSAEDADRAVPQVELDVPPAPTAAR